jgi:hypothetical protein
LSILKFRAHLSILRNKISALAKIRLVWSNADSTLLRHAYSTQPYCNTLATNAFTSYSFTRTFDIPNSLQFDLIAKNTLLDLFILAYRRVSGFLLLFARISPKYLNSFTEVTYIFPILSLSLQLTYIAFVFLTLTVSAFSAQNYTRQSVSAYNSLGLGAMRTRSSAKASKNNCSEAIVYALRLLPFILRYL